MPKFKKVLSRNKNPDGRGSLVATKWRSFGKTDGVVLPPLLNGVFLTRENQTILDHAFVDLYLILSNDHLSPETKRILLSLNDHVTDLALLYFGFGACEIELMRTCDRKTYDALHLQLNVLAIEAFQIGTDELYFDEEKFEKLFDRGLPESLKGKDVLGMPKKIGGLESCADELKTQVINWNNLTEDEKSKMKKVIRDSFPEGVPVVEDIREKIAVNKNEILVTLNFLVGEILNAQKITENDKQIFAKIRAAVSQLENPDLQALGKEFTATLMNKLFKVWNDVDYDVKLQLVYKVWNDVFVPDLRSGDFKGFVNFRDKIKECCHLLDLQEGGINRPSRAPNAPNVLEGDDGIIDGLVGGHAGDNNSFENSGLNLLLERDGYSPTQTQKELLKNAWRANNYKDQFRVYKKWINEHPEVSLGQIKEVDIVLKMIKDAIVFPQQVQPQVQLPQAPMQSTISNGLSYSADWNALSFASQVDQLEVWERSNEYSIVTNVFESLTDSDRVRIQQTFGHIPIAYLNSMFKQLDSPFADEQLAFRIAWGLLSKRQREAFVRRLLLKQFGINVIPNVLNASEQKKIKETLQKLWDITDDPECYYIAKDLINFEGENGINKFPHMAEFQPELLLNAFLACVFNGVGIGTNEVRFRAAIVAMFPQPVPGDDNLQGKALKDKMKQLLGFGLEQLKRFMEYKIVQILLRQPPPVIHNELLKLFKPLLEIEEELKNDKNKVRDRSICLEYLGKQLKVLLDAYISRMKGVCAKLLHSMVKDNVEEFSLEHRDQLLKIVNTYDFKTVRELFQKFLINVQKDIVRKRTEKKDVEAAAMEAAIAELLSIGKELDAKDGPCFMYEDFQLKTMKFFEGPLAVCYESSEKPSVVIKKIEQHMNARDEFLTGKNHSGVQIFPKKGGKGGTEAVFSLSVGEKPTKEHIRDLVTYILTYLETGDLGEICINTDYPEVVKAFKTVIAFLYLYRPDLMKNGINFRVAKKLAEGNRKCNQINVQRSVEELNNFVNSYCGDPKNEPRIVPLKVIEFLNGELIGPWNQYDKWHGKVYNNVSDLPKTFSELLGDVFIKEIGDNEKKKFLSEQEEWQGKQFENYMSRSWGETGKSVWKWIGGGVYRNAMMGCLECMQEKNPELNVQLFGEAYINQQLRLALAAYINGENYNAIIRKLLDKLNHEYEECPPDVRRHYKLLLMQIVLTFSDKNADDNMRNFQEEFKNQCLAYTKGNVVESGKKVIFKDNGKNPFVNLVQPPVQQQQVVPPVNQGGPNPNLNHP